MLRITIAEQGKRKPRPTPGIVDHGHSASATLRSSLAGQGRSGRGASSPSPRNRGCCERLFARAGEEKRRGGEELLLLEFAIVAGKRRDGDAELAEYSPTAPVFDADPMFDDAWLFRSEKKGHVTQRCCAAASQSPSAADHREL
nr:hypothetical protein Iba_chr01bCG4260 [Ipomoea batatas]